MLVPKRSVPHAWRGRSSKRRRHAGLARSVWPARLRQQDENRWRSLVGTGRSCLMRLRPGQKPRLQNLEEHVRAKTEQAEDQNAHKDLIGTHEALRFHDV